MSLRKTAVLPEFLKRLAGLLRSRVRSLAGVTTPDRLAAPHPAPVPALHEEDAALIQYTSRSTGDGSMATDGNEGDRANVTAPASPMSDATSVTTKAAPMRSRTTIPHSTRGRQTPGVPWAQVGA